MLKLVQRLGLSILISGISAVPLGLQAQPSEPLAIVKGVSGIYNDVLKVGINPAQDRITGYYDSSSGWDETLQAPRFVCQFYFAGEWKNDRYQITSWYPESDQFIAGEARFQDENGTPTIALELEEEHGGCWNVQHFADPGGATAQLTQRSEWQAVRLIAAQYPWIYDAPASETATPLGISPDSPDRVVGILATREDWVEVEWSEAGDSNSPQQGWLPTLALYPEHPPTGQLQGTVIFPSDALPGQRICAEPVEFEGQTICTETPEAEAEFTLAVPPGTYHVFAQSCQQIYKESQFCEDDYGADRAYYNEYVACGITYQCSLEILQQGNAPIPVQVEAGQIIRDVSPHDWYTL